MNQYSTMNTDQRKTVRTKPLIVHQRQIFYEGNTTEKQNWISSVCSTIQRIKCEVELLTTSMLYAGPAPCKKHISHRQQH